MAHTAEVRAVGVNVSEEGLGVPTVILAARDELLPISIGPDQAQAIEFARQGLPSERPLTHDLLVEMVTDFGGAIDQVRIDDLVDNTFYAKLDAELIQEGNRHRFVFDARPSDGMALAVRVGCPITITDEVLDMASWPDDTFDHEGLDDRDPDLGW